MSQYSVFATKAYPSKTEYIFLHLVAGTTVCVLMWSLVSSNVGKENTAPIWNQTNSTHIPGNEAIVSKSTTKNE
jgi:hypothetical protein